VGYRLGMAASRRRHFGTVRKLRSGAWQARYWMAGTQRPGPTTFRTRGDALAWLSAAEADQRRGTWIDPKAGRVSLGHYSNTWLVQRSDLRASTRAKYRHLLDRHILPTLGVTEIALLKPSAVRSWWSTLADVQPATAAGAYRLLSTICNTAVVDQVIVRSPCQVKGGGAERAAERPTITVAELAGAIDGVRERMRAAILLAAWCQLRRSEVLGLQRHDVDLERGVLHVRRGFVVQIDGKKAIGRPKTDAGVRTIAIPANVLPVVVDHLAEHVAPESTAWLFPGASGQPVAPRTLDRAWTRARESVGRPDLRLHDLRHSGLTWAAATGATTAELMSRAGHASPAAALRYQHATQDRDRALADALAALSER